MSISSMISSMPSLGEIQKIGEGVSQHFETIENHLRFLEHDIMGKLNDLLTQIEKLRKENEK